MDTKDSRKPKSYPQPKQGLKHTLEGVLDRLREELDELASGFRPKDPQLVPIPIPVQRPRRR